MPAPTAESGTVYNPFLYDATPGQLERFLLIGVCVAGKVARQQQEKFDMFEMLLWRRHRDARSLFALLRAAGEQEVYDTLRVVKMGQYARITAAFMGLARSALELESCTRDQLCDIKGIGMKTASFFILFTRRYAPISCLDVHILNYLRETGLAPHAPRATPGSLKLYLDLEAIFVKHAQELGRPTGELDFEIWLKRNRGDILQRKRQSVLSSGPDRPSRCGKGIAQPRVAAESQRS
jgi:hypothetical protein